MKHKISISISEKTLIKVMEKLRSSSLFRNKSHLIEYAINTLLGEEK